MDDTSLIKSRSEILKQDLIELRDSESGYQKSLLRRALKRIEALEGALAKIANLSTTAQQ